MSLAVPAIKVAEKDRSITPTPEYNVSDQCLDLIQRAELMFKGYVSMLQDYAAANDFFGVRVMIRGAGMDEREYAMGAAAAGGHLEMITFLESFGVNHYSYRRGIVAAAGHDQIEVMKYFVESSKVTKYDKAQGMIEAARCGRFAAVKYLISMGVNDPKDFDDAICVASRDGQLDMVKFLESQPGVPPDRNWDRDLRFAAYNGISK